MKKKLTAQQKFAQLGGKSRWANISKEKRSEIMRKVSKGIKHSKLTYSK